MLLTFLLILSISFCASAVTIDDKATNKIISVPFPSPDSFGKCAQSMIIYDEVSKRYTMFVLTYDLAPHVSDPLSVSFKATLNCANNDSNLTFDTISFKITCSSDYATYSGDSLSNSVQVIASNFYIYRFNYVEGGSSYTIDKRTISWDNNFTGSLVLRKTDSANGFGMQSNTGSASYGSSGSFNWVTSYTRVYGGAFFTPLYKNSNISYSFTSTEGGAILSVVNKMNSTLNSVNGKVDTVNGNLNDIKGGINQANGKLNEIEDSLNSGNATLGSIDARLEEANQYIDYYGNGITFYLNEILEQLQDKSYSPEETTTNEAISNYNSAEGALMDDNINQLNNFEMPDINSFNSGSQKNAFAFISNNIEFFSGMTGSGSVSKISTVLLVILGLGLASFIIGMTNRRKG